MIYFSNPAGLMKTSLVVGLLVAAVLDRVPAQGDRASGAASVPVARTIAGSQAESSVLTVRPGGQTTWWIKSPRTAAAPHSGPLNPVVDQLPFGAVGFRGIAPAGSSSTFLVGGMDPTTGNGAMTVLTLVGDANGARSIAFSAVENLGSIDPTTVVWNAVDQRIYCVDYNTEAVYSAPWNGVAPLPGLASFSFAALGINLSLDIISSAMEAAPLGGVRISPPEPLSGPPVWLHTSGGVWLWGEETAPPANQVLEVNCLDYIGAGYDAYVRASTTGAFTVETLAGSVVYSGTITAPNTWSTIPVGTFQLNTPYKTRFQGVLSDAIIRPVVRHTEPTSSAPQSEVVVGRAHISSDGPILDRPDFIVSGWVSAPVTSGSVDVLVALGLGLDNPTAPTTQVGSLVMMGNLIWIAGPWVVSMTPQSPTKYYSFMQAAGAPSGLALGMVPVYQWAVVTPGNVIVLSDVAGSQVY